MISEVASNAAIGGVFGLLIGSFLNVVIHRLPRMMEQEWNAEGAQWVEEQVEKGAKIQLPPAAEPITLSKPRSLPALRPPDCLVRKHSCSELSLFARTLRRVQKAHQPALPRGGTGLCCAVCLLPQP